MSDCIFCKIIRKEIPKELIYESENVVVFEDIHPAADIHILIVPKKHIEGIKDLTDSDGLLLVEVYKTANKLVADNNLENDLYRVMANGGKAQHVPHLHFHLLGGQWKRTV
ncbi:MAG: HIT domain-containing protein [Candidatus Daviesbacteria bacterium]|nr:HIT domain-containing protein [Candidatus Daviesbacteria bacterium]